MDVLAKKNTRALRILVVSIISFLSMKICIVYGAKSDHVLMFVLVILG